MKPFKLTSPKPQPPKEWIEQRKLFDFARANEAKDPRWALLNASQNGLRVANPGIIMMAKLCGLKVGYPDTFLPVIGYASCPGMFVEIKRKHGKWITNDWDCCATDEQRWWRDMLLAQGYEVKLAHGGDEAIAFYEGYLKAAAALGI